MKGNNVNIQSGSSWAPYLENEFKKSYFSSLLDFVHNEYKTKTIYPQKKDIFRAFRSCPFENTRVVILGQDPYHGEGQSNGMAFSVGSQVRIPPSLRNIYKELNTDIGKPIATHGDLSHWATAGVLLLNATLTVRAHSPGSHQGKGWEQFTDSVIKILSTEKEHIVFILWGAYAQKKGRVIDRSKHCVITSPHPSPFSAHRGFFGSKPFSRTNSYLKSQGFDPIEW